jgi:hypothetical protein
METALLPVGWQTGWAPEPVWTWRSENSCPYGDSNSDPSVVQPVASCYTGSHIGLPAKCDHLLVLISFRRPQLTPASQTSYFVFNKERSERMLHHRRVRLVKSVSPIMSHYGNLTSVETLSSSFFIKDWATQNVITIKTSWRTND